MTKRNGSSDPTANVRELVAAEKERADDLREADEKLATVRSSHVEFVAKLRASHSKEMRDSDNDRFAAQRREDQVTAAADKKTVLDAVQALAATTESVRLQLEKRVADTAETMAKSKTESDKANEVRVSALEKIAFTGAGEKAVSDPAMAQLVDVVTKLVANSSERRGGAFAWDKVIAIVALAIAAAAVFFKG